MSQSGIAGRRVLITGANRGIGLEFLRAVLSHGAERVYAAVRRPESFASLEEAADARVQVVPIDLGDEGLISHAAEQASDVDLVICNAGVLRTATVFSDDVFEALQFELEGNLFGFIRLVRAFAPVLARNGGGTLVQLNSIVSMKCFPDFTTYCASKAAAYAVTQALKFQLAEQGTRVVSIHPGPIATDMGNAAGLADVAEPANLVADALIEALAGEEFHVWPDATAKQIGDAYESFAKNVVEVELTE